MHTKGRPERGQEATPVPTSALSGLALASPRPPHWPVPAHPVQGPSISTLTPSKPQPADPGPMHPAIPGAQWHSYTPTKHQSFGNYLFPVWVF